jgi:hypothetical protein
LSSASQQYRHCCVRWILYGFSPNRKVTFSIEDETKDPQTQFTGVNFIPGLPTDQSAYRSELGGASGIIAVIESIVEVFGLQSGTITIGLDGEQAMWNAPNTDNFFNLKQPSFNMLSDIHANTRNSVITYHWKWVKGHQLNQGISYSQMDQWGQLNHEADQLDKAYALACITEGRIPTLKVFKDEGWQVFLHGNKLSSLHFDSLYAAIYGIPSLTYWTNKCNLPAPVTQINWTLIHTALRSLPFGKKRWLIKHLTGVCGVGKMMHRWNKGTSHCPHCDRLNEDTLHVIICPAPCAMITWDKSLKISSQWMIDSKTLPQLCTFIIQTLQRWRIGQDPPPTPTHDDFGLHHAIIKETRIGWKNFLDGFILTKWQQVQS